MAAESFRLLPFDDMWRPAVRTYATQAREQTVRKVGRSTGGGRRDSRPTLTSVPLPPYRQWLKSGAQAYRFPKPRRGPHWLGETPFPQNPFFHPSPPVHQSVRDDMWRLHAQSPHQWTVRSLSSKFRVSLERTEAILRLKALEDVYTKEVCFLRVCNDAYQSISLEDSVMVRLYPTN